MNGRDINRDVEQYLREADPNSFCLNADETLSRFRLYWGKEAFKTAIYKAMYGGVT